MAACRRAPEAESIERHLPADATLLAGMGADAIWAWNKAGLTIVRRESGKITVDGPGGSGGSVLWPKAQPLLHGQAWMVSEGPPSPLEPMLTGNARNVWNLLRRFHRMQAVARDGAVQFEGECSSAGEAEDVAASMRGLGTLLRLPGWKVEAAGVKVKASGQVDLGKWLPK